jgi:formiminoglutamase
MLTHFKFYSKQDVLAFTKIRKFETKLGERLQVISSISDFEAALKNSKAKFVLFGIPEDIGVKANNGIGGADSAWTPFLQSFLNIQSNDFLDGEEILLLGHFDFSEIASLIDNNAQSDDEKLLAYRHAVNTVDAKVEQLMHLITQNRKMPIVIGGGHNNAYPCIRGAAKGWHKAGVINIAEINAINLDAHADYRPMEGRHSGNGFRYAEEDGYLEKYCIIGLHENYITQNTWMDMVNNPFVDCITYEDIFVKEKRNFMQAVAHAAGFTEDTLCGIELDLDSIENTLSSATSPSGISSQNARQFISYTASTTRPAYLHICEGATTLADGRNDTQTGKLISYLVSDFVKAILDVLNDVED